MGEGGSWKAGEVGWDELVVASVRAPSDLCLGERMHRSREHPPGSGGTKFQAERELSFPEIRVRVDCQR